MSVSGGFLFPVSAVTGLDFPGIAGTTTTMRFNFSNPQSNGLPIYGPSGQGVTIIWRAYPRQQASFYTTFFWANDDGTGTLNTCWFWDSGNIGSTWGAHPYPDPSPNGTDHFWEIACEGQDAVAGSHIVYDRWYTQAFRCWGASGNVKHHEFYYDLPDTAKVVTYTTSSSSWGDNLPPFPKLTFGDAPHNEGGEVYSGILRNFLIYNDLLSTADILNEYASPGSTVDGAASLWYKNLNPTPSDISDKSGNGHHPSWVGSERPTLYST